MTEYIDIDEVFASQRLRDGRRSESEPMGNEVELASKMRAAAAELSAYLKSPSTTPERQIAFDENDDPFNLLSVSDTYEIAAGEIFHVCEVFFSKMLQDDRKQLKTHSKTGVSSFVQKKSSLYSFELKRIENESSTIFSFGRADDRTNETGFEIVKSSNGTVVLRSRGDTVVTDDESYFNLIYRARNAIADFVSSFKGYDAAKLAQLEARPIPRYYRVRPPKKVRNAGRTGGVAVSNFLHPEKVVRNGRGEVILSEGRKFSRKRAAAIPILLFSLLGTQMIADNFIFNNSERSREVFDHGQHSLPNVDTVQIDGKTHKFTLAPVNTDINGWTPRIELTSDMQNLRGIRSITSGDAGGDISIMEGECDSAYVDLGGKKSVKAVTDSKAVADNLNFSLTDIDGETRLEICATGDYGLTENNVWLEAV